MLRRQAFVRIWKGRTGFAVGVAVVALLGTLAVGDAFNHGTARWHNFIDYFDGPLFGGLAIWSLVMVRRARRDAERLEGVAVTATDRYDHLFADAPIGLFRTRLDGTILAANPSLHDLLGVPRDYPLVGSKTMEWYAQPSDREPFMAHLSADGAVADHILRLRRKDGTEATVIANCRSVKCAGGGDIVIEGALTDVSDRLHVARRLRESEARFLDVVEHIKEIFFDIDIATGRVNYISPTWADVYGRPIEEGRDPQIWFNAIHPDDRAAMVASQAVVRSGSPDEVTFRIMRPDGTVRWLRGRAFPVRNDAGEVCRRVGVSEDITALRASEERFVQAQKLEAVGRLAGGVAHDFNNLLTVIIAETDYAMGLPLSPDQRESLTNVRSAADGAASLSRQLLLFSRRQIAEPVVFDLNDVVAGTGKLLHRLIGEDVTLEVRTHADAGRIRADRGQFEQVITNLAVNARDAMPEGGVLTIETRPTVVEQGLFAAGEAVAPGSYVALIVRDTGTGMTPEVLAHAFEPFFTTKERGKGTGLGLATCHGIVRQAGGHILIDSVPGRGTTFTILLPRVVELVERAPATATSDGGAETILFVEDDAAVRAVGVRLARSLGYTVIEARDGIEALQIAACRKCGIDLLITDMVMPSINGHDLADGVRDIRPGLPVLYVTGYTNDVLVQQHLLEPGVDILSKPYTRATLARKVRDMLDRAAAAAGGDPRNPAQLPAHSV